MARKAGAAAATAPPTSTTPTTTTTVPTTTSSASSATTSSSIRNTNNTQDIVLHVWNNYVEKTPQRTKLIDSFLAFLVVVGGLQFVYCVIGGNYPFNAFLAGFAATVGQFVLTASLRLQTNPENAADFKQISNERAFADYVFGSLLLHFFCINFIN